MNFSSQRSRQSAVGPTPRRSNANERPTPGPSRQRQSGAAPQGVAKAPAYEPPAFTLNPAGQRALAALIRSHDLGKLTKTLSDAQDKLGEAAMNINDRFHEREEHTSKTREKRQRNEEDQEGDEFMEQLEAELTVMRTNVNGLTVRIEEKFRKLIDGKQSVKWMTESVNAAADDARNNASTQASTPNTRSRRTRGTAAEDDEEENKDEDEEIEDFQPTDPAAGTQPERAPLNVFQTGMKNHGEKFQSASLYQRYAQDNDYINFKRTVHDALYPNDDVPLAPATEWFNDDGTVAAPGQTRRHDEGDDSDEDIVIERASTSTKCPLTLREFEDVVTAVELCHHSFEKTAIYSLIGARPAVQCPVGGCKEMLRKSDLKKDPVVVRRIQRLQRAKQTQAEASDEEDEFGGGTQATAQMIDEDDDDDGVQAPRRETQRTQMKKEPRATATPGPSTAPPGGTQGTQVVDLGSDDDEDEDD